LPAGELRRKLELEMQKKPLFSREQLGRMRAGLIGLHDDIAAFVDRSGQAAADSRAAQELAEAAISEEVFTALSQGSLLLESVADHCYALTQTLVEPISTMAPWTLVRASIESGALSCWLLSHRITRRERVGRSLAFRYEGLIQQSKLAQSSNDAKSQQTIRSRIDELETEGAALGYTPVQDRNGKRIGVGQQMPAATKCIRETLDEEATYRLLSGVAHSHTWAIIQAGFHAPDPSTPTSLAKHLSSEAVAWLLRHAADALARPIWEKMLLFGFDNRKLEAILTRRYEEMERQARTFFWRQAQPS
jgi:hypothetical protein